MKKAVQILPEGYKEILSVDMAGDKKLAVIINGLALVIAAVMAAVMVFIVPIDSLFEGNQTEAQRVIKMLTLVVGMVLYLVLHEAVHGIAMKYYGCQKVRFGFKGAYAFAATDDYLPRKPYVVIALAPIVVWGAVFAVMNLLVPADWFWIVYILQICNISGAAGDLYISLRLRKLPDDILVQDSGVSMNVYSARG